jgi:hypothetical protein
MGVLTMRRPNYMVVDLDLEEMTTRKEKPRTGLATGASVVENTDVLGLGFIPNRYNKERHKKQEEAIRSGTREAQG